MQVLNNFFTCVFAVRRMYYLHHLWHTTMCFFCHGEGLLEARMELGPLHALVCAALDTPHLCPAK